MIIEIGTQDFKKIKFNALNNGYNFDIIILGTMINRHLQYDTDIDSPMQLKNPHDDLVEKGLLKDHGGNTYSMTPLGVVTIYEYAGKHNFLSCTTPTSPLVDS